MPPTLQDHQDDHRAADFDALDEIGAALSRCLDGPVSPHLREQIHDAAHAVGLREVARRDVKRLALAPPAPGRPLKRTAAREPMLMVVPPQHRSPRAASDEMWRELHDLTAKWSTSALPASDVHMLAAIDDACVGRLGERPRRLRVVD